MKTMLQSWEEALLQNGAKEQVREHGLGGKVSPVDKTGVPVPAMS